MASLSAQIDPWEQAKARFLEGLSDEEKYLFRAATPENIYYKASATNIIHEGNSKTRSIIHKIQPFIQRVEQYGKALDVYSGAASLPMCPLWGTIRVLFVIAEGYDKYFGKLLDMLAQIGDILPSLSAYVSLFPTHHLLMHGISEIYLDILKFCTKAKTVFQNARGRTFLKISASLRPFWKVFDQDFADALEDFRRHRSFIETQVNISHMTEAAQERSAAKRARLAEELANKEISRVALLQKLSSTEQRMHRQRIRKQQHPGTGRWAIESKTFNLWLAEPVSSFLWCSGIPGCGKSVLSAAVVDELENRYQGAGEAVIYYFCDYNDPSQLRAAEIFGNLSKQLLSKLQISGPLLDRVEKTYQEPWLVEAADASDILAEAIRLYKKVFIVLDGLDECTKSERSDVLRDFHSLESTLTDDCVKKFWISSRGEIDIERGIGQFHHILMDKDSVSEDISSYVAASVEEKRTHGEFAGISPTLLDEIVQTLSQKNDGMFLWVQFQISDLCSEPTAKGIRETLATLPKDLPETFERALRKAHPKPTGDMILAQKVFKWLICANGLIFLDELLEAVAIDVGDEQLNRDKIPADHSRLLQVCANLVVFDKDDRLLHFAHHSVQEFLVSSTTEVHCPNFYFALEETRKEIAHLCFTYLHFNDFQSQLVLGQSSENHVDTALLDPEYVVRALDLPASRTALPLARLLLGGFPGRSKMRKIDPTAYGVSKNSKTNEKLYPFLPYVTNNWLYHASHIEKEKASTQLWELFEELVLGNSVSLSIRPWVDLNEADEISKIEAWETQTGNTALAQVVHGRRRSHEDGLQPPGFTHGAVAMARARRKSILRLGLGR